MKVQKNTAAEWVSRYGEANVNAVQGEAEIKDVWKKKMEQDDFYLDYKRAQAKGKSLFKHKRLSGDAAFSNRKGKSYVGHIKVEKKRDDACDARYREYGS